MSRIPLLDPRLPLSLVSRPPGTKICFTGVRGVSNLITVAAKPTPTDIKKRITEVENRLTVDPGVYTAV